MSNGERRRELIFGILYTLAGSLMFLGGLLAESSKGILGGFVFLIIGGFSWIKLAANSRPKKVENNRPVKQNAAHMAREMELAELKAKQEQVRAEHDALAASNSAPLVLRKWSPSFKWDWKHDQYPLNKTLYIRSIGTTALAISNVSFGHENVCVLQNKNGVWYLSNVNYNTSVRMNPSVVREKCDGMPVNTQEYSVAKGEETPLAPGDCISVTQAQKILFLRVDVLQPDSN